MATLSRTFRLQSDLRQTTRAITQGNNRRHVIGHPEKAASRSIRRTATLGLGKVQENPGLDTPYAHAGILAAAKAVWADLEEHGILDVLLDKSEPPKVEIPVADAPGSNAGGSAGQVHASGGSGGFAGDEEAMERGASCTATRGAQGSEVQLSEVGDVNPTCRSFCHDALRDL